MQNHKHGDPTSFFVTAISKYDCFVDIETRLAVQIQQY